VSVEAGDGAKPARDLYCPVRVQGEDMLLLLDTGSSNTILTNEQYLLLPKEVRPELGPANVQLIQADGGRVKIWGIIGVEVGVGPGGRKTEVIVADVKNGMLGMDILEPMGGCLDFSQSQLYMGGGVIQLRSSGDGGRDSVGASRNTVVRGTTPTGVRSPVVVRDGSKRNVSAHNTVVENGAPTRKWSEVVKGTAVEDRRREYEGKYGQAWGCRNQNGWTSYQPVRAQQPDVNCCRYCKGAGHWKRECPTLRTKLTLDRRMKERLDVGHQQRRVGIAQGRQAEERKTTEEVRKAGERRRQERGRKELARQEGEVRTQQEEVRKEDERRRQERGEKEQARQEVEVRKRQEEERKEDRRRQQERERKECERQAAESRRQAAIKEREQQAAESKRRAETKERERQAAEGRRQAEITQQEGQERKSQEQEKKAEEGKRQEEVRRQQDERRGNEKKTRDCVENERKERERQEGEEKERLRLDTERREHARHVEVLKRREKETGEQAGHHLEIMKRREMERKEQVRQGQEKRRQEDERKDGERKRLEELREKEEAKKRQQDKVRCHQEGLGKEQLRVRERGATVEETVESCGNVVGLG
jgi:hypothetical protein